MKKVIIAKKKTEILRRCLNCGKDITNMRKDSNFCCKMCYNSYHETWRRKESFV